MNYSEVEPKHLGGGVVLFEKTAELDWDWMYDFCESSVEQERKDMYTPAKSIDNLHDGYVNKSGFWFTQQSIEEMPYRATMIHRNRDLQAIKTLAFLDEVKYRCLIKYMELFPQSYKCIWWYSKGHITEYKNGSHMGPHADIQTDYRYGFPHPTSQLAMKNTTATILYVNDSVDSVDQLNGKNFLEGAHEFTYLNITYKPKRGDILMFPSDYMATHKIHPTTEGKRYAYLGWYCQGTPDPQRNERVSDPLLNSESIIAEANVYLPFLRDDYFNHIKSKGYASNTQQYIVAAEHTQATY